MKKIALTLALIALPATAMAMGTTPSTEPAPSRELVELRELNGNAALAYNAAPADEKAASDKFFAPMTAAVGAATKADNPRQPKAFAKAAADVRKHYASACAVLSGC